MEIKNSFNFSSETVGWFNKLSSFELKKEALEKWTEKSIHDLVSKVKEKYEELRSSNTDESDEIFIEWEELSLIEAHTAVTPRDVERVFANAPFYGEADMVAIKKISDFNQKKRTIIIK